MNIVERDDFQLSVISDVAISKLVYFEPVCQACVLCMPHSGSPQNGRQTPLQNVLKKTARQPTHRNWIKKKPHLELERAAGSITEMVL